MNAIYNKSFSDIHNFLRECPAQKEKTEKFLKTLEDPLTIQAVNALPVFYNNLQIMAYESLI